MRIWVLYAVTLCLSLSVRVHADDSPFSSEFQQLVAEKTTLSSVKDNIESFLNDVSSSQRMLKLFNLKKEIFSLEDQDYERAIWFIEQHWSLSPTRALQLISQLQLHWQLLFHKDLAKRLNQDTDEISRTGLIIGLAAMSVILIRHPERTNKYLRLFSYAFPLAGQKAGTLIGRSNYDASGIKRSPADLLQNTHFDSFNENELQGLLDELTATSIALGGSAAVTRLMTLRDLAKGGARLSSRVGRLAKQALFLSVLFVAIEKSSGMILENVRLSNLVDDEVNGLFTLRDQVEKASKIDHAPFNFFLNSFMVRTHEVEQLLHREFFSVYQDYVLRDSELETEIQMQLHNKDHKTVQDLRKKQNDLKDQTISALKGSLTGPCQNTWISYSSANDELESDELESIIFTYGNSNTAKIILQRRIKFLQEQNLAQNPPGLFTRTFRNYREYHEKEFKKAMESHVLRLKYHDQLRALLKQIEAHWLSQYNRQKLCEHPKVFLKQTELFLRSLNLPSAHLSADQIQSELQLIDIL
ncbi:MAG: hypothetical protein KDD61_05495 [Bdellovibrionales bacterium]|nr:hypothetical protein [Bdellovibrionales bacterium]